MNSTRRPSARDCERSTPLRACSQPSLNMAQTADRSPHGFPLMDLPAEIVHKVVTDYQVCLFVISIRLRSIF
jgi:hypothetical protein